MTALVVTSFLRQGNHCFVSPRYAQRNNAEVSIKMDDLKKCIVDLRCISGNCGSIDAIKEELYAAFSSDRTEVRKDLGTALCEVKEYISKLKPSAEICESFKDAEFTSRNEKYKGRTLTSLEYKQLLRVGAKKRIRCVSEALVNLAEVSAVDLGEYSKQPNGIVWINSDEFELSTQDINYDRLLHELANVAEYIIDAIEKKLDSDQYDA